jgi:Ser/Thr protein kinase RdoA (MazF antagonist)
VKPDDDVLAAWGWADAEIAPVVGGLINATFAVRRDGAPIAVVQRLHPVFGAEVNLDLEAVTRHLAARGMTTPTLIRTRDGEAWFERGGVWRALTWIDGASVHAVPEPRWAEAGGELVGRFHRAVADLDHRYHFARAGVHDTAAHLGRLRGRLDEPVAPDEDPRVGEARELGADILAAAIALPPLDEALPRRHCHGDLKISNLVFAEPPLRGVCLLDLDTLGLGTLAFELGDAMRSWCNPHGEDRGAARFDLAVFTAAMGAWRDVAGRLAGRDELASVVAGLETVCVELAARFAVDVFDDRYFGWDPARFGSRRAHNLVRAQGQLALARSVRDHRDAALEVMLR